MVAPSVSISTSGSLRLAGSPTRLNHRPIDAFVTDVPIFGTRISVAMRAILEHRHVTSFQYAQDTGLWQCLPLCLSSQDPWSRSPKPEEGHVQRKGHLSLIHI